MAQMNKLHQCDTIADCRMLPSEQLKPLLQLAFQKLRRSQGKFCVETLPEPEMVASPEAALPMIASPEPAIATWALPATLPSTTSPEPAIDMSTSPAVPPVTEPEPAIDRSRRPATGSGPPDEGTPAYVCLDRGFHIPNRQTLQGTAQLIKGVIPPRNVLGTICHKTPSGAFSISFP